MFLKKKFFFIEISLVLIVFFYCLYIGFDRHWSLNYDQELTLSYHALIFSSGEYSEYFPHTGYFTILFLSFFFWLSSLFQIINVESISYLNSSTDFSGSLQELVFIARILAYTCTSIFLIIFFKFIENIINDKITSYLLSLTLITSYGLLIHSIQLRTELIASLFLFISIIFLVRFLKSNKQKAHKYLFLFIFFVLISAVNKIQTLFYLPAYLLIIFVFIESQNKINDLNIRIFKYNFLKFFLLIFLILFFIIIKSPELSSILLLFFLIFYLNFIFFIYFKYFCKQNIKGLYYLNFYLILSFLLLNLITLLHPSTNENLYDVFFRIFNYRMYGNSLIAQEHDKLIWISNFASLLKNNIIFVIKDFFTNLTYQSIIFYSQIIMLVIIRKQINRKFIYSIILINLIFLLIEILSQFRGRHSYYDIFTDFLLILGFSLCIAKLKFNKNKRAAAAVLFLILIFINQETILSKQINNRVDRVDQLCKPGNNYFYHWHQSLSRSQIDHYCNW